ncbi:MAG: hypothetical protein KTR20_15960 [Cellvibrionaceae bacterium]|nr:hypothetical protein [Cellvibrionaceae bacterium]
MLRNYYSAEPLPHLLKDPQVLMVVSYNGSCEAKTLGEIPCGLSTINHSSINEVWAVREGHVTRGTQGRFHWHQTDDILCVATWLSATECQSMAHTTEQVYLGLLRCFNEHGYYHPTRIWHYLGDINLGKGDRETYKQFCSGRLKAFTTAGVNEKQYPAASALGHHRSGAVIFGFATRTLGVHHQNTLQLDAYKYPREYGPSSPSFARATSLMLGEQPLVFVSGTASIIGHKTTGINDLQHQLDMTISNINHLLVSANPKQLPLSSLKAYVRHRKDAERVTQALGQHFPDIDLLVIHADICRTDLLLEVECFCG